MIHVEIPSISPSYYRIVVEVVASGGLVLNSDFRTIKLLRYVTPFDYFVLACECAFLLFVIYYIIEEIMEVSPIELAFSNRKWVFSHFEVSWLCMIDGMCLCVGNSCFTSEWALQFSVIALLYTSRSYMISRNVFAIQSSVWLSNNKCSTLLRTVAFRQCLWPKMVIGNP